MPQDLTFQNLGGIPSKRDYRSEIVAAHLASFAPVNPTPDLPKALGTQFFQQNGIYMQSKTPSCVSHSVVELMKLYWFLKIGKVINFNPQYLHIKSAFPGAGPEDGRDEATVLSMAKSVGCCTSETLPINTNVTNAQYCDPSNITPAMDAEASQYKIPGYTPVGLTQESIRNAIKTYGAVGLVFQIGQEYFTSINGVTSWAQADIDPVRPPKVIISGHAVTGTGWNEDLDHLVNHWSSLWAQNGESDWIFNEWEPFLIEAWTIAEVPGPVLATVQGLPSAHEFKYNFTTQLSRGMQGQEVRALQIALSIDGETTYPEINGIFGPLTQQAVILFQQKYDSDILYSQGLTRPTGIVGPMTLKKLNNLFNN